MIMGSTARPSRFMKVSAVTLASALVLSACGGGASSDKAPAEGKEGSTKIDINPQPVDKLEQGGTLQLSVGVVGQDWNPFSANGGNSADLGAILEPIANAGLWNSKADGSLEPKKEYLESANSELKDGKQVITYKLNPKAKWNDGTPIDYKTFENQWNVFSGKNKDFAIITSSGYEDIEKVEKGSTDHEVIVTMKKEFYPWEELFSGLMHPAINTPEIFNNGFKKPHPEWMAGPFKLDKYDEAARTVSVIPNEKWWGDKPVLDKIVFRAMESSAQIPAFKNGEIDAVSVASISRYQQAAGAPNSEERRGQRLAVFGFMFNSKAESPVKDLQVRKAFWQGTDPKPLLDIRFKGLNWEETRPGSWMSMPFSPYYENNLPVEFSTSDAEKTLDEAGWKKGSDGIREKDGKKLTVKLKTFGDDPTTAALAQTYQAQMKGLGIDLKIDNSASSQSSDIMSKRAFEVVLMGYGVGNDPTNTPKQFYKAGAEDLSGIGNPDLDKMIAEQKMVPDTKERAASANAVEKKAMEHYGMLPLWNGPTIALYRTGLANYGPSLFQTTDWTKVGFEKK